MRTLLVSLRAAAAVALSICVSAAFAGVDQRYRTSKGGKLVAEQEEKLVKAMEKQSGRERVLTAEKLFILRAARVLCDYHQMEDGKDEESDPVMKQCMNLNLETSDLLVLNRFPRFCEIAAKAGSSKKDCEKDAKKATELLKKFDARLTRGDTSKKFSEEIIDESNKFGTGNEGDGDGGSAGGAQR